MQRRDFVKMLFGLPFIGIGAKLGYLPRADNTFIANLLDQGALVSGSIKTMHADKQPWGKLEISIQMGRTA